MSKKSEAYKTQMYFVVGYKLDSLSIPDRHVIRGMVTSHIGDPIEPELTRQEMSRIMLAAKLELRRIVIGRKNKVEDKDKRKPKKVTRHKLGK